MVTADADGPVVSRPSLASLIVDHPDEWVLGSAAHAAIEVRADRPGASFRRLPLPTLASLNDAVGIELATSTGTTALSLEPGALDGSSQEGPTFDLGSGASRRVLLDVSGLLIGVAAGIYTARISYGTVSKRAQSDRFVITLREPDDDERRVLEMLRTEGGGAGSWGDWTYQRRPRESPWLFLASADPLRYHLVLNQLIFGPQDLAEVVPAVLEGVDSVTKPEAAAIRAELLAARRSKQEFDTQAALVRQKWPGLGWWMDAIAQGRSEIAFLHDTNRGKTS